MPAAIAQACCSVMPVSWQRAGKLSPNASSPVPEGIAAVIACTRRSRSASLINASEKTLVYDGPLLGMALEARSAVEGANFFASPPEAGGDAGGDWASAVATSVIGLEVPLALGSGAFTPCTRSGCDSAFGWP